MLQIPTSFPTPHSPRVGETKEVADGTAIYAYGVLPGGLLRTEPLKCRICVDIGIFVVITVYDVIITGESIMTIKLIRKDLLNKRIQFKKAKNAQELDSYRGIKPSDTFLLVDGETKTYYFQLNICKVTSLDLTQKPERENFPFPAYEMTLNKYFECLEKDKATESLNKFFKGYIKFPA